ncbi:MAG: hypothetical protein ACFCU1_07840 [Sumerlaeia bacterium]
MKKNRMFVAAAGCSLLALGVAAQVASQLSEDEVRNKIARTKSDLRSLHTAVESYKVDWGFYPSSIYSLTTPISYITSIPQDQFEDYLPEGKPLPEHLTPIGGFFGKPGELKLGVIQSVEVGMNSQYIIYGVGPDGMDNRGTLEYDPTNGTFSAGDLIRYISTEQLPFIFYDAALRDDLTKTFSHHSAIREAIIARGMALRDFPSSLNQLTTPVAYLSTVPEDPFLPGLPMGYRVTGEGDDREALIYSVGPDLVDDKAEFALKIGSPTASKQSGDVILSVRWNEIESRLKPFNDESSYAEGVHPWRAALLKWQDENGGRDNALLWYHEATLLAPGMPTHEQQEILDSIIKGEKDFDETQLLPWLNLWDEAIPMIEKGTEVDFAEGTHPTEGMGTPVPNFLVAQMAAKVLVAKAVLAAKAGDLDSAIRFYKTCLIMGRDYQSEGLFLISHLIGYAITNIASRSVMITMHENKLTPKQLAELRNCMIRVEATKEPLITAVRNEFEALAIQVEIEFSKTDEDQLEKINTFLKENGKAPLAERPSIESVQALFKNYGDQIIQQLQGQYDQRTYQVPEIPESQDPFVSALLGIQKNNGPNYREISTREASTVANLRLAQIATAVLFFEQETGLPPASLQEVAPLFNGAIPTDPFSGEPIHYSVINDSEWKLWSVGPDGDSDEGATYYDPVNGIDSDGDIVYPKLN